MEKTHAAKNQRNLAPCANTVLHKRIRLHRVPGLKAFSQLKENKYNI
jgi:hypothetical protein